MKKQKHCSLREIFFTISVACFWLMLTGCSKQPEADIDPFPDMSTELRTLQGSWVDINTNDSVECTVVFQGYTIRVRYQAAPEAVTQKQNASIDRLDEARNLILINGGSGAWPYDYLKDNGTENLQLEFFATDGWHQLNLYRAD